MGEGNIKEGSLVKVLAGRDKGRYFVAVSVHDGRVAIADGRRHKLSRPKLKNPKHISPTGYECETNGLTEKKLRRLIFEFKTQDPSCRKTPSLKTGE